MFYQINKLKS